MSPRQRLAGKVVASLVIALLLVPGFVLQMLRDAGRDVFAISVGVVTAFWLIRAAWQDYEAEKRRTSGRSQQNARYEWVRRDV